MNELDYTSVDYAGIKQMMIKALQSRIPEYTDTSETDAGIVILEALAMGLDIMNYYQNRQANECFLVSAERRNNILKWAKMLGYVPRAHTAAKYKQHFNIALSSIGADGFTIPKGFRVQTQATSTSDSEVFSTLEQVTVVSDPSVSLGYSIKETESNAHIIEVVGNKDMPGSYAVVAVPIAHGIVIDAEHITGTATPNQRYTLSYSPVVLPSYDPKGNADFSTDGCDSITVTVETEQRQEPWFLKDSFIDSTVTDRHYILQVNEDNSVTIVFGDGVNGAYPTSTDIIVTYRTGGGSIGNVGANTIVSMVSPQAGIISTYNPESCYEAGKDKETNVELKQNIPNSYRTKWGCLQTQDYADKLIEIYGESLLLVSSYKKSDRYPFDSSNIVESLKILDTVCVCVLPKPESLYNAEVNRYYKLSDFGGSLSDELRDEMLKVLEERGLIGTYSVIEKFESKKVHLKCTLLPTVGNTEPFDDLAERVNSYLCECFALGNMKPGIILSLYDIEALVYSNVSGIRAFRINSYSCDEGRQSESDTNIDVTSKAWEILELGDVQFWTSSNTGANPNVTFTN